MMQNDADWFCASDEDRGAVWTEAHDAAVAAMPSLAALVAKLDTPEELTAQAVGSEMLAAFAAVREVCIRSDRAFKLAHAGKAKHLVGPGMDIDVHECVATALLDASDLFPTGWLIMQFVRVCAMLEHASALSCLITDDEEPPMGSWSAPLVLQVQEIETPKPSLPPTAAS